MAKPQAILASTFLERRFTIRLLGGASSLALCMAAAPAMAAAPHGSPRNQSAGQQDSSRPQTGDQDEDQDNGGVAPTDSAATEPQTDQPVNEIVVTGIRSSLKSAQALKRNSDVVGDSITAEDIGALPDRSVTEALQRVPGVSISHFEAGVDPDHFSTEGSGVVIRGLTYTRSELNGRDTFSANNQRGLSFADVPSELLGGVDVFKSPSAEMIEGGIAGTVNLRTRKPFDADGLVVAGTAEINYGDFVDNSAPTVSALVSDRWDTGIGEFGVLASFVRSEVVSRADSVQISNWGERLLGNDGVLYQPGATYDDGEPIPGTTMYLPRGAAQRSQEFDRTRYGYSAALQYRSPDESLNATFQFLRSDSRQTWTEHSIEVATDNVLSNGDAQPYPGTEFAYDDDNVFTDGIITAPNGYRAGDNPRAPENGLQSNNISRGNNGRFVTSDYSANIKWNATDRLAVNLDYQHVDSFVDVYDMTIWGSTFQNAEIHMHGDDPATVDFLPIGNETTPYFDEAHDSYLDPYNSFYRSAMDHIEQSKGNEDAARIDLDYAFPDDPWLESLRAGYRFSDRKNVSKSTSYNWGALSEIWGGSGPVWFDESVDGDPNSAGGSPGPQEAFFYDNFFRGQANDASHGGRLFAPSDLVLDYDAASQAGLAIGDEWRDRLLDGCPQNWVPVAQRCDTLDGTPFLPGEVNPIHERTHAAYVQASWDHDFNNGWDLSGNVGFRYVHTDRRASGFLSFPQNTVTCEEADDGTPPRPICSYGPELIDAVNRFQNGATTATTSDLSYDYLLPSLNAKLSVGGGLQFRLAINRAIAPPDFDDTRNYYNVALNTDDQVVLSNNGPIGIFQIGNPNLKPVVAHNYDATAEWYFSDVGQLTLSLFHKDLYNVATTSTERQSFTNNGETFDAIVTTPLNSDDVGKINGLELAYQQTYDFLPGILSGLGLSANFTYVDSSGVSNSSIDPDDPNVADGNLVSVDTSKLPLEGLSKYQFNVTPFYSRNGLEIRAAYSWRSRNLLTTRDVIVPNSPVFNEAYGQLDASIFYAVTDNIRMGFQAVNLTNSISETQYVINDELLKRPRNWFINDTRFTFSIRAQFGD
ncbi:TonB-dependent receptor [Stakelama saccharophila]|uniref:TonB-dependent receptor n=1 Tax=Stakelama saccharophila TaxID=3075605 RepID=A0ABZ0B4R0_9SPHN|nr:TonB-dependent receptor [Stakelama sp. W311]WNO52372.1 TonB-dependent receptor [Stakelama sp. W311]